MFGVIIKSMFPTVPSLLDSRIGKPGFRGSAVNLETLMENNVLIDTLNILIETSRDGDKGFTACAEDAKDASLRSYFTICATRCRRSVHILEELVKNHAGTPERFGSVMGPVNRAWLNLRAAISSNSDLAVLEECERAEDAAIRAYQSALTKDLPAEVRRTVLVQLEGAQENHDRVRSMRDDKKRLAA
jgi:uncharacterized protein (TIGR02284 family)